MLDNYRQKLLNKRLKLTLLFIQLYSLNFEQIVENFSSLLV